MKIYLMNKYFINKKKLNSSIIVIIEKQFINSFVNKLESNNVLNKVINISLGSISLDISIKKKHTIKKIIEINGANFSEKTILTLNIILDIQKSGGIIVFIDLDQTLDIFHIKKFGIIIERLFIIQPNNIDKGLKILKILIKSGIIHFIVINSINKLISKSKSSNLYKLLNFNNTIKQFILTVLQNDISILFISQLYINTNIFFKKLKTKGFILNNYLFIRLNIKKTKYLKKNNKVIGNKIIIKSIQKKIILYYKLIELDILYKYGFSKELELLKLGIKSEILKKSINGIMYNKNILGNNYNSIYKYIKENNKIAKKIETEILSYFYKKIKSRNLNFSYK